MGLCIQKEPYKTDNILQKKPTILRSLLIVATPYVCIGLCIHNGTSPQRLHFGSVMLSCKLSTANSTRGDIFECCFKAQSSKLEPLFSLKRGKRDVRALSFELSKMSPQVGLAVPMMTLQTPILRGATLLDGYNIYI